MSPELQSYYERRLSMMGDRAWQDLLDDVKAMYDATNDLNSVSDEKQLQFRKGELSMMNWILTLKEVSEEAYSTLKDQDENFA